MFFFESGFATIGVGWCSGYGWEDVHEDSRRTVHTVHESARGRERN